MGIFSSIGHAAGSRDPDGQAPSPRFRAAAVAEREVDEMIGIIKGILADGDVVAEEARFLRDWIDRHAGMSDEWPGSVLYPRIRNALADDVLSSDEEAELLGLFQSAVGGNASPRGEKSMATTLPLCNPAPTITFEGRAFCFTGACYSGTRTWCESQVLARGGSIASVSKKLSFLVIGEIGSRDWIHSTHGRKIEKAVELRDGGAPLSIVSEKQWHSHLEQ